MLSVGLFSQTGCHRTRHGKDIVAKRFFVKTAVKRRTNHQTSKSLSRTVAEVAVPRSPSSVLQHLLSAQNSPVNTKRHQNGAHALFSALSPTQSKSFVLSVFSSKNSKKFGKPSNQPPNHPKNYILISISNLSAFAFASTSYPMAVARHFITYSPSPLPFLLLESPL